MMVMTKQMKKIRISLKPKESFKLIDRLMRLAIINELFLYLNLMTEHFQHLMFQKIINHI